MGKRIFVTGATGLVGFHVVKRLLSGGYEVVAGVRASSKTEPLRSLGAAGALTLAETELNSNSLQPKFAGIDAVVHCAGAVDPHAQREQIRAINVDGTRAALEAAVAAGVKQFVHISSLSVITGQEDQFDVDETAPLRYCGEAYADSKVDAEKVVHEFAGKIATTILRPGFIYGDGERAWLPRLVDSISTGKAMLIDGGTRKTNVIYVENLATAVENSLFNEKTYGQSYNLTDEVTPTKKELFDAVADGAGVPRVTKTVPRPVVKAVCDVVSVIAPMLPVDARKGLSRFSRGAFRLAGVNQGFSIAKAKDDLNYRNLVPFSQGMAQTMKSFNRQSTKSLDALVGSK